MRAIAGFDFSAIWLTLRLALVTTSVLLVIGTGLAWWLATSSSKLRSVVSALVALPLILPPTVLGFYLLLLMGPNGPLGQLVAFLGLAPLPFTFTGLVVGSVFYSLPFVVQPIQNAFEAIAAGQFELAATLGAGPWDRFFTIALPLAKPGLFSACILGFAHTVGEFGIVLMLGGNIPGRTRVLSVAIYDQVEAMEYSTAHSLSAALLIFSLAILLVMNWLRRPLRIS